MANRQQVKTLGLICSIWIWAVGFCTNATSQELAKLRGEVRSSKAEPKPKVKKPTQPHCDDSSFAQRRHQNGSPETSLSSSDCDDEYSLSSLLGGAMMAGLSMPFLIPRSMAGDDSFDSGYFLRYPYLHDQDAAIDEYLYSPDVNRHFMLRTRGEYVSDFDTLSKVGGSVLFDTSSRWGLDSEFNYRREDLGSSKDSLWTGDANVVYRFAQSEKLQMRTGVGFNWLSDQSKNDLGFNFTYGGDWFPTKPVIVSHEIDWGKLGHASLFHGRVTLGANYHRLEPYIGYEYFSVGHADFNGLVFGARLWLSRF